MVRLADTIEEVDEKQRNAYVDQINKMVEELPPTRMSLTNEKKLTEMGIADELAKQYLDSPHFTPRHDAIIVNSLASLNGANGREIFFQMAIWADSEEDANYFQNMAEIPHGYNLKVSPITDLSKLSFLLVAQARNGTTMVPCPIDHGVWREPIDHASQALLALYPNGNIELLVMGTVSALARLQFRERGIKVKEHVDRMIPFMD